MSFLRSIKSTKALGLAVVTAATMMAINVAPSQAQVPQRTITLKNEAGFTSHMFIIGVNSPSVRTFDTGPLLLGQSKSVNVPLGATVFVFIRMENFRKTSLYQNQSFTVKDNACFKSSGTVFNPSGGFC